MANRKNGDTPAFATPSVFKEFDKIEQGSFGLTKREYFAGLAMQGMLANNSIMTATQFDRKSLAEDAVWCADELLKQLEQ